LIEKAQALLEQALDLLGSEGAPQAKPKHQRKAKAAPATKSSGNVDFSTPFRTFVKRHATGMSGARKFTLLVAYIAKGDEKVCT
jgi:hypothetical protein